MTLVSDGELAVAEGVPELDCSVPRAGNDLAVVGREGDGENIVGVADKGAGGVASGQFPQTESLVPGAGESIGTVGGDDLLCKSPISHAHASNFPPSTKSLSQAVFPELTYTVRDNVGVTVKASLGVSICCLVAGQVPDDQGLVATGGEEHVGARKVTGNQYLPSSLHTSSMLSIAGGNPYFSIDVAREVTQPL